MARRRKNGRNRGLRTRQTKDRNHRKEALARPFPDVVYQPAPEPTARPKHRHVTADGEELTPARIAELRRLGWGRRHEDGVWMPPEHWKRG